MYDKLREAAQEVVDAQYLGGMNLDTVNAYKKLHEILDARTLLHLIECAEGYEKMRDGIDKLTFEWINSGNGHWRDVYKAVGYTPLADWEVDLLRGNP